MVADWLLGAFAAPLNLGDGQLYAIDDAKAQIWLPELVRKALRDLAGLPGMFDSDAVPSSVFAHLCGPWPMSKT